MSKGGEDTIESIYLSVGALAGSRIRFRSRSPPLKGPPSCGPVLWDEGVSRDDDADGGGGGGRLSLRLVR